MRKQIEKNKQITFVSKKAFFAANAAAAAAVEIMRWKSASPTRSDEKLDATANPKISSSLPVPGEP